MEPFDGLLALNNAHAAETSLLGMGELRRMFASAFFARGTAQSLIIAFDQDADYASPNFLWFKARHGRFVYVDRVIVASAARGRGLARQMYDDLFTAAGDAGHGLVTCEVNRDPPNPGSDAFHAAMGFAEVGQARLEERGKTVRYLLRTV